MPSGKTHDAVTLLLAAPTFVLTWRVSGNLALAAVTTAAFLFGGLMFGPDLDTQSVQYTRWGVFRWLWFPYKAFFAHRSRWSHGLVFGTLLRTVYFAGVVTLLAIVTVYVGTAMTGGEFPALARVAQTWQTIGEYARLHVGENVIWAILIGLEIGAASHTLTDIAGTFLKTGKVKDLL